MEESDEVVLQKLELIREGLARTAILLFGREPQRFLVTQGILQKVGKTGKGQALHSPGDRMTVENRLLS